MISDPVSTIKKMLNNKKNRYDLSGEFGVWEKAQAGRSRKGFSWCPSCNYNILIIFYKATK